MAKKYKHIPSGIEVTEVQGLASIDQPSGKQYSYRTNDGYRIPAWIVSGSDWEEVKEKDWEIVSCRRTTDDIVFERCGSDRRFRSTKCSFSYGDNLYNYATLAINSVRRFRDGEVFTVGDSFQFNNLELPRKTYFISKLTMYSLGCAATTTEGIEYNLAYAAKVKEPVVLFTTHDGVAVTQSNLEVYSVCATSVWETRMTTYEKHGNKKHGTAFTPASPWKHFYSREKRDEYILYNKPCLSFNDLAQLKNSLGRVLRKEDISNLVKSKLNK